MFRVRASLLAAAFIILLQISTFAASPYVWRSVAINGGGFVSGIVFHPKQKDLAYARTDVGGAYRWSASTQSWIALNDDLGSDDSQLLGVLSIALDPSNPDLVYLACGQYLAGWAHHGAILRSTDRGSTWSRSDLSINLGGNSDGRSAGERLQVDPNSSNILYLGSSQDGLWKSADAGATWAKVSSFPGSAVVFIAIDPLSKDSSNISRTIYASADSSSGSLYRSTDAGSTWALVPGAPSGLKGYRGVIDKNGALLCVFNDGLGPNGVNTGALWKFQPGTSAWTNLSVPTGQGGFGGVSVDPNNPSLIVVSTLDRWNGGDQIYRTTDGGATWKAILNKANIDSSSAPWSASSSPHWIGDVQADPFNPANIFFVTGYGIFATANATNADTSATVTWTFCNKGLEETVPLGIISPPTGTAALISVVGDVDGFRHENLDISPPTRLTPTIGTTNDIAYAGSAPDSLVRVGTTVGQYSTDTGKNWTAFPATPPLASGSGAVTISADGSRFLWMPSKSGVYLSTNQGRTWTASTGSPSSTTDSFTPVADRVNAQKFYILQTVTGVLYRSTDGGSSFSTAAAGLPKGTAELAALPDKEGDLWAATNSGGLYHSTDSGTSFSQIPGIQEAYRVGFGKAAPGSTYPAIFIFAKIANKKALYRSDDAGTTWTRINDDLHQFGWVNGVTGDPRAYGRIYLATGGRGILYGDIGLPSITTQPLSQGVAVGSSASLDVTASNATQIQWYKDGIIIPGATNASYVIASVTSSDAGEYKAYLAGQSGSTTSATATLSLAPAIVNKLGAISTRSYVGPGDDAMIAGFVIVGTQSKRVLIRAGGPALQPQGVANYLSDPIVTVYASGVPIASNDDWDSAPASGIAVAAEKFYAGAYTPGSKDAALLLKLPPGNYSAVVAGKNNATGVAMAEVYDVDEAPTASKLLAISTRSMVKKNEQIQIAGFVISGNAPMRVVIRAVGPSMAYSLPNLLLNPYLEVRKAGTPVATNDDWGSTAILRQAFAASYLAPYIEGSKDSALITTLDPGAYPALVSGVGGTEGIAMVEVYEYP